MVSRFFNHPQFMLENSAYTSVFGAIFLSYNCYYEKFSDGTIKNIQDEIPFELPDTWSWVRLGVIFSHNTGKALKTSNTIGKKLTYITTSNLYWNSFVVESLKEMYFTESEIEKYTICKGDLLVCEGGDIGRAAIWTFDYDMRIQNHIHKLRAYYPIETKLYYYTFYYYKLIGKISGNGIGIQGLSSNALHNLIVPLPPIQEQTRITAAVNKCFLTADIIDENEKILQTDIEELKFKILELAIQGKLVPQDENDEPASVLLERIRAERKAKLGKKYVESYIYKGDDNCYYQKIDNQESVYTKKLILPKGWVACSISDISYLINARQIQLKSENVRSTGKIPIVSQGHDLIDGYCNLSENIIKDVPVVIFGDHTRNVKYIDFPFVVGADGTKIHKVLIINEKYVYYWMLCSANKISDRGYARHYALLKKECFPLPPLNEQSRIVRKIEQLFSILKDGV